MNCLNDDLDTPRETPWDDFERRTLKMDHYLTIALQDESLTETDRIHLMEAHSEVKSLIADIPEYKYLAELGSIVASADHAEVLSDMAEVDKDEPYYDAD